MPERSRGPRAGRAGADGPALLPTGTEPEVGAVRAARRAAVESHPVIRVGLVDDEELVRAGLRLLLSAAADLDVVGEARDGAAAVELVRCTPVDVLLMDIRMPVLDGVAATARVLATPSPPRVVLLTTFDLDEYVHDGLRAGAAGFMLKDTPPAELLQGVRVVARGDAVLGPTVTRRLLRTFRDGTSDRGRAARARVDAVTGREREVLVELAAGRPNAEIGARLYLSEATVKTHVTRILAKLGVTNRVQAAIVAHDAGLLDDPR